MAWPHPPLQLSRPRSEAAPAAPGIRPPFPPPPPPPPSPPAPPPPSPPHPPPGTSQDARSLCAPPYAWGGVTPPRQGSAFDLRGWLLGFGLRGPRSGPGAIKNGSRTIRSHFGSSHFGSSHFCPSDSARDCIGLPPRTDSRNVLFCCTELCSVSDFSSQFSRYYCCLYSCCFVGCRCHQVQRQLAIDHG